MENFFISKELVVLDKNQLLFEVLKAFCKKQYVKYLFVTIKGENKNTRVKIDRYIRDTTKNFRKFV